MAYACNPSVQKADAIGWQLPGQHDKHSEILLHSPSPPNSDLPCLSTILLPFSRLGTYARLPYTILNGSLINIFSFPFVIILNFIGEQLAQTHHTQPGRVRQCQAGLGSVPFTILQHPLSCGHPQWMGRASLVPASLLGNMPCTSLFA